MNKRRAENKSTEDLSVASLKKKAKELDQITSTTRFDKFFAKNKSKIIPNLTRHRSRSTSQDPPVGNRDNPENDIATPSEFITPKRTVRRTEPKDNTGATTSNTYDPLNTPMSQENDIISNNSTRATHSGKSPNSKPQQTDSQNNSRSANAFKAKAKPPPIHVYEANMKNIVKIIIDAEISEDDFWVRELNNYISVNPQNLETYKKIKQLLDTNLLQYFTFTPKEEKKITLVLKGVKADYNENDVKTFIINKKLQDVHLENVTKLQFDKSDENKYFYLVHLSPESRSSALTKLRYILHQPVRWENIRKKAIFQCRRCQRIGHASRNCNFKFRCVKCGKDHGPIKEGNKCELEKAELKDIFCINCGQKGHPASYPGCPYLITAQDLKKESQFVKQSLRNDRLNKFNTYVNPQRSYNQAAKYNPENFPPLPRTRFEDRQSYWNDTTNHRPAQKENHEQFINLNRDNQDLGNNFTQIERLLNSFKTSLTESLKEQFDIINKQITDNSRRIDYILTQLDFE